MGMRLCLQGTLALRLMPINLEGMHVKLDIQPLSATTRIEIS